MGMLRRGLGFWKEFLDCEWETSLDTNEHEFFIRNDLTYCASGCNVLVWRD